MNFLDDTKIQIGIIIVVIILVSGIIYKRSMSPTTKPPSMSPTTPYPTTPYPRTPMPTTPYPRTPMPTTPYPRTPMPTTPYPRTPMPTTPYPTTPYPTTPRPPITLPPTLTPFINWSTSTSGLAISQSRYSGYRTNLPNISIPSSIRTSNATVTIKATFVPTTSSYADGFIYWGLPGFGEVTINPSNQATIVQYYVQNQSYASLPSWLQPNGTLSFYVVLNPQDGNVSAWEFNSTIEVIVT